MGALLFLPKSLILSIVFLDALWTDRENTMFDTHRGTETELKGSPALLAL